MITVQRLSKLTRSLGSSNVGRFCAQTNPIKTIVYPVNKNNKMVAGIGWFATSSILSMATRSGSSYNHEVLVFGNASEQMLSKLDDGKVFVHWANEVLKTNDDYDENKAIPWLEENGSKLDYVMTSAFAGLPTEYMDYMPNIKLISNFGVGYDGVDTPKAVSKKILVTHTPTVLNAETATTAILLYLASYRNFRNDEEYARSGQWTETGIAAPLSRTADGRLVGLLGMGRIGQCIAKKLLAFDSKIAYHSRNLNPELKEYKYYDDLIQMAKDVDCLIAIVPGAPETKHIVNKEVMEALGPDGTLINVARGSVVDEKALVQALTEGKLGYAALDVYENEPHIPSELRSMDNVVLLPHVGSATIETRAAMGALTVDNVLQHIKDGTVITPVPECTHLC